MVANEFHFKKRHKINPDCSYNCSFYSFLSQFCLVKWTRHTFWKVVGDLGVLLMKLFLSSKLSPLPVASATWNSTKLLRFVPVSQKKPSKTWSIPLSRLENCNSLLVGRLKYLVLRRDGGEGEGGGRGRMEGEYRTLLLDLCVEAVTVPMSLPPPPPPPRPFPFPCRAGFLRAFSVTC